MLKEDLIQGVSLYILKCITLTKIFPQIGWAVPQCLWPISHLWPPMMNFKHEEDFLRCNRYHEQHAMLSVPFRLTYFSTRNSSTQVSASNPVLLFHCSCHGAQDKEEEKRRARRRNKVHQVHMSSPFTASAFSSDNWTSKSTEVLCENCHNDGQPALTISLL